MLSRCLVATWLAVLVLGAPSRAQPEDYQIHGGYRVGGFRVGVRVARMIAVLGREEVSGSWATSWGRGRAFYWPRKGFNAKACGADDYLVEVNVYVPRLPAEVLADLMVEIGKYQIWRQIGIRTPSALLPEYFGQPDEHRVVPSQLGATRTSMYWHDQGLHMEAEFGEVVEIGAVVIPPRCP